MGFVEDIANAIIDGLEATVFKLLWELVIRPMSQFVAGLIGFLQDVIVGTPYPRVSETSTVPAVLDEPGNQPWQFLYQLHEDIFQPYAYLLLFIILLTAIFLETFSGLLNDSASGKVSKVKKNFFQAFLMVTFWWYLGTLILATSDALTRLLMSAVSGEDPDSIGLVAVWGAVTEEITGENIQNVGDSGQASDSAPVSTILMIPLIVLWLVEALILIIIAILWVLRMFVIFVLMPVMPIFIAFYAMHLPGFDKIQDLGTTALKWFVSLAFVTLPAAIVIAVSGRIIEDVLSFGTEALLGSGRMAEPGVQVEALNSYNTQQVIAHPQVSETVYGDGVAGLGAGQGQMVEIIAGLGGILFAIILVIVIPILAGLAPLILYRSEAVDLGQGAINPAAGVMKEVGKAKKRAGSVKNAAQAARGKDVEDYDMQETLQGDNLREALTGDNLTHNLANNQAALFGLAGSKGAKETQKRASQMRSGAQTASARTRSGLSKVDDYQMMARKNRGAFTDAVQHNMREGAKKMVDPKKQHERLLSIAETPGNISDSVDQFADDVVEQGHRISRTVEGRRMKAQQFEDMDQASARQMLETKAYTPDASSIDKIAEHDDSVVNADTKEEMVTYLDEFSTRGRQSVEKADGAIQAMQNTIDNTFKGTSYNPAHYNKFLTQLSDRVRKGEITPEEAMDIAEEAVIDDIKTRVTTDQDMHDEVAHMEEMYEKLGANFSSMDEFRAQTLSSEELQNLPGLEEVLEGHGVRKNRLKRALKESPKNVNLDDIDLDVLAENPEQILNYVDADSFNEHNISDHFEAQKELDIGEVQSRFGLSRGDVEGMDVEAFQSVLEQEQESDLDSSKASELLREGADMSKLDLASYDTDDFESFLFSDLASEDDDRNIDNEKLSEVFDVDTSEFEGLDSSSDLKNTSAGQKIQAELNKLAKEKGEAFGQSMVDLENAKHDVVASKIAAKEEYQETVMKELLNNAPSKEAAANMLASQEAAVLEAAGAEMDAENLNFGGRDFDDEEFADFREDIITEVIEQELSGEEIHSAISKRFHEKYDSTDEMLENLSEINATKEVLKQLENAEEEQLVDMDEVKESFEQELQNVQSEVESATKLEELGKDMSLDEFQEEFGAEITEMMDTSTVEGQDASTLEQLGVDSDDISQKQIDEVKQQKLNEIQSSIEDKFDVSASDVGMSEVTTDNIEEFAQKAAKKKAARDVDQKVMAQQIGDELEDKKS